MEEAHGKKLDGKHKNIFTTKIDIDFDITHQIILYVFSGVEVPEALPEEVVVEGAAVEAVVK